MKRNTLNGSVQNGNHHSDHDSYEKQEILQMLQKTVVAQEKRLTEMADDIKHFKSIEQVSSKNGLLPLTTLFYMRILSYCVVFFFTDFFFFFIM